MLVLVYDGNIRELLLLLLARELNLSGIMNRESGWRKRRRGIHTTPRNSSVEQERDAR